MEPRFAGVVEVMEHAVADGRERGIAVCATVGGIPVLDAWCGDWSRDTMAATFSCTKGATALCAQILHDRGALDVEAPVSRYWPEFGANGKEGVLVKHVLSHTAGVLTFDGYPELLGLDGLGLADWELMTSRLAGAPPSWEPGTKSFYHALSYGFLVGELVRRIDGRSLGRFFADEVAAPLGLQFWIGLPPELHGRTSDSVPAATVDPAALEGDARALHEFMTGVYTRARELVAAGSATAYDALPVSSYFLHPEHPRPEAFLAELVNAPWMRRAELPAGNGIGTARALARMYALLALGGELDGVRLVSRESIDRFSTVESQLPGMAPFCLGYHRLAADPPRPGPGRSSFGHAGAGGNLAYADPENGVSFALVKSQMTVGPEPTLSLLRALYEALG